MMILIFVSHLYDVDYLPFNQPSTNLSEITKKMKFEIQCLREKMLKKDKTIKISFSNTETTLLKKQQRCVI